MKKYFFILFLLMLVLLPVNIYSMQKNEKINNEVIVGGELLQINVNTDKLMYYRKGIENEVFEQYDLIESMEGYTINKIFNQYKISDVKREDILKIVLYMQEDSIINITVKRNNIEKHIVAKKSDLNPSYFTEEIPFSASLTYIDPNNNSFGAIAHGVDINNSEVLLREEGQIFLCGQAIVNKSSTGDVGSMYGEQINYTQGTIDKINNFGAKGRITGKKILENKNIYEVAYAKDVMVGAASLIIEEDGHKEVYNINITKVNKQSSPETQGFEFKVDDKKLMDKYGGIVQGMSGCPIIQNGKLVGALSHVITTNPAEGVGLYIQWMMEE